jgi:hypothetical protein
VKRLPRWRAWVLVLALLIAPLGAFAQDLLPVPAPSARVIDQTGTLAPEQRAALVIERDTLQQQLTALAETHAQHTAAAEAEHKKLLAAREHAVAQVAEIRSEFDRGGREPLAFFTHERLRRERGEQARIPDGAKRPGVAGELRSLELPAGGRGTAVAHNRCKYTSW